MNRRTTGKYTQYIYIHDKYNVRGVIRLTCYTAVPATPT